MMVHYQKISLLAMTNARLEKWNRRVATDDHCTATHNYEPNNQHQQPQQQQIHHAKHQKRQVFQIPKLGLRKFAI
jgi:hypothetical protein